LLVPQLTSNSPIPPALLPTAPPDVAGIHGAGAKGSSHGGFAHLPCVFGKAIGLLAQLGEETAERRREFGLLAQQR
jgi:hypothetical protein